MDGSGDRRSGRIGEERWASLVGGVGPCVTRRTSMASSSTIGLSSGYCRFSARAGRSDAEFAEGDGSGETERIEAVSATLALS